MMLSRAVSESEITPPETESKFSTLRVSVVMSKATGSVTVSVKGSISVSCPKTAVFLDNNFHHSLEE